MVRGGMCCNRMNAWQYHDLNVHPLYHSCMRRLPNKASMVVAAWSDTSRSVIGIPSVSDQSC